jgi:hypothetical protein
MLDGHWRRSFGAIAASSMIARSKCSPRAGSALSSV